MTRLVRVAIALGLLASPACRRVEPFHGPLKLLDLKTASDAFPRLGSLTVHGDARPALLQSARFRVALPARPLLTLAMGASYAGQGEAPGWYQLTVRAGAKTLLEKKLNPRVAGRWHDVSVPLDGVGAEATLDLELRLTDRDGRDVPRPAEVLLGVAEPTIHDLDDYGGAKGVLLVSIDTVRRDHVGAYGYPKPTTPRLDALAREGILCEDAVSTSSWTLPAHLSLMTSADPGVHGGVDSDRAFNHRVPTLAATLRKAGYATQAVTSHLYVSAVYGLDDGFDHLDFQQDRKATDVANHAIAILDRLGDRPFFLFLHFYDPHWHYDPPKETRRLFETSYTGKITGLWQDFSTHTRATTSAADLAHLLALYDGEIRYVDDEVGRILDHLRARALDRNTLVVATSDHGEEFLEHGSWEHQKTLYEELIRIPLFVRGPGVSPRRETAQTTLLDVAPTILAWAKVAPAGTLQGKSLLASPGERESYGETDHTLDGTRKLFLRAGQGRGKTILSLAPDGNNLRGEEWYDLATDAAEAHASTPRAAVADPIRRRALERWRDDRGRGSGAPAVCLSAEQRERLRSLGYVSDAPEGPCPVERTERAPARR